MTTNVRDTSLAAYDALDLTQGQTKIMRFLSENTYRCDWTRGEIAKYGGFPIQSVCGRVNELLAQGRLTEQERVRPCRVTGNSAHPVSIPREPEQTSLLP